MEEDDHTLLYRNIDAKVDPFSMHIEKHLMKLPDSLQFIKEYIYFDFLPKVDFWLDELEKIKTTTNYDENIAKIRPVAIRVPQNDITCLDLLGNHNIKHCKINRMLYGTSSGVVVVYDIEGDKCVVEKKISNANNRVDAIASATTKYFDTYLTRIAATCRSEQNVVIMSYNHSFSVMNIDTVISTADQPGLAGLINSLKFSKDGFYLSGIDYKGGVRIWKFHEIPVSSNKEITTTTESAKDGKKEKKDPSSKDLSKDAKDAKEKQDKEVGKDVLKDNKDLYMFISYIQCNNKENFTILPNEIGNPSEGAGTGAKDQKGKNTKDTKEKDKKPPKGKDPKQKGKDDKAQNDVPLDENMYNIKSEYDELNRDISLYQKFSDRHPVVHFIQKKFIFEDKYNTGYSSSTVTTGVYIAFLNSTCFKYISLYPYLTDNMKTIFKVSKVKTTNTLSIEESMSLNSQMAKKEKEFLNFIKKKLDTTTPQAKPEVSKEVVNAPPEKTTKEKEAKGKKEPVDTTSSTGSKSITINPSDITKNEIAFTTLFNISTMSGQRNINTINNLLAIGMTDGSIIVWDCELHTDKFLFQKNSRFEITYLVIDENYLLSGSMEGYIYIYDLINGTEIFSCAHNPYETTPIITSLAFFPFMVLAVDDSNIVNVYNMKEKGKAGKILLDDIDNQNIIYRIKYANKYQVDYNDEFAAMICEKEESSKEKKSLIDLIKFQDERKEYIRNKPNTTSTNFFNATQIALNPIIEKPPTPEVKEENAEEQNEPVPITKIELKQKYLLIFRIRDILFKCYPNLIYAYKKGLSLKKIMKTYSSDSFPTFERNSSIADNNDKLNNSKNSVKNDLLANLSQPNETLSKSNEDAVTKKVSTQQKDIFYNSFKSIRQRYQYKEQRANNIMMRNEKILKELNKKKK